MHDRLFSQAPVRRLQRQQAFDIGECSSASQQRFPGECFQNRMQNVRHQAILGDRPGSQERIQPLIRRTSDADADHRHFPLQKILHRQLAPHPRRDDRDIETIGESKRDFFRACLRAAAQRSQECREEYDAGAQVES